MKNRRTPKKAWDKLCLEAHEAQLSSLTRKVVGAKIAADLQSGAFREEARIEVLILEKTIEAVKDVLPLICSKIEGWPMRAVLIASPNLFVNEDGTFVEQDPGSGGPRLIAIPDVLDYYPPEDVIEGLAELFQKQVDGRSSSARGVEIRVKKLRAIIALLED